MSTPNNSPLPTIIFVIVLSFFAFVFIKQHADNATASVATQTPLTDTATATAGGVQASPASSTPADSGSPHQNLKERLLVRRSNH